MQRPGALCLHAKPGNRNSAMNSEIQFDSLNIDALNELGCPMPNIFWQDLHEKPGMKNYPEACMPET